MSGPFMMPPTPGWGALPPDPLELFRAGRLAEALPGLEKRLAVTPRNQHVRYALAHCLLAAGRAREAGDIMSPLAYELSADVGVQFEYGTMLAASGRHADALRVFEKCIALAPTELAPYDRAANCHLQLGNLAACTALYDKSIAANPDRAESYWQALQCMTKLGLMAEAVDFTRRGTRALPASPDLHEFLCYLLNSDERTTPEQHLEAHRTLGSLLNPGGAPKPQHALAAHDPERPLRIAFISGDFRSHACAFFLAGLVRELDRSRFTPFLYCNNAPDETTHRMAQLATMRSIVGVNDDALIAQARTDQIDIAIDCSGWTEGNRLHAFAKRLAPVQATYLGYPSTTGLPSMDWRIVDSVTDPIGTESACTERIDRIDPCFLSYQVSSQAPRPRMSSGLTSGGPITFGSFSRLSKIGPETAALWSAVLNAVAGSRLLLKTERIAPIAETLLVQRFAAHGVTPERIRFVPYMPDPLQHLDAYGDVDIALDPLHYNGTTTTCEAALMGVPTVSLRGPTHRSRVGASLLTAMGTPELVATDAADFVRIAASLAADRSALISLRESLPAKFRASIVCDPKSHARAFEQVLRRMWHETTTEVVRP